MYKTYNDVDRALKKAIGEPAASQSVIKNCARGDDQTLYWHIGFHESISGSEALIQAVSAYCALTSRVFYIRAAN
jgi:hypothetical protein